MLTPDRYWLLTWTTYATWLPGDDRGSVVDNRRHRQNTPGTPYLAAQSAIHRRAVAAQAGAPVYLTADQAAVVLTQFQNTAAYRGWSLRAAAVMRNHVHLVVGVPGDPEPDTLLRDFKSYASRALNGRWPKPASGTWWTQSGSTRKLSDVPAAVGYVLTQEYPLVVWSADAAVPGERPAVPGERPAVPGERPA